MKIQTLEIHNFASYLGTHNLDFSTDAGLDGYAVFGDIGRGKTSIMKAVLWCLYGQVESFDGKEIVKITLIDESQFGKDKAQKFPPPLICDTAVRNNNFNMHVTMKFESNGKKYILKRETSTDKNPRDDNDISVTAHLSIDDSTVKTTYIPSVINQVIPERISRFFFIEMDAIDRYANLLFTSDANSSANSALIKSDIEAILGFPAIGKSKEDFSGLSETYRNKIQRLKRQGNVPKTIERQLAQITERMKAIKDDKNQIEEDLMKTRGRIKAIENELRKLPNTQALMKEKDNLTDTDTGLIPKTENEIKKLYETRRAKLSDQAWLYVIQNQITSKISTLQQERDKKRDLTGEVANLDTRISIIKTQLSLKDGEEWDCPFCKEKRRSKNKEEKVQLEGELYELKEERIQLSDEIEGIGNPEGHLDSLSVFKNRFSDFANEIKDIEFNIGTKIVELSNLNSQLDRVKKDLDQSDEEHVRSLNIEHKKLMKVEGGYDTLLTQAITAYEEDKEQIAQLTRNLEVSEKHAKKAQEYTLIADTFDWLERMYSDALSSARDIAKSSVEEISNNTFLSVITESERYSKLTISPDWEIMVFDATPEQRRARLANPGHRQIVAVSLFDGLRTTSKRNYPTFFDNPGSNISDEVLYKMATHFWNQDNGQVIMLSHGGGLKEDESIANYGSSLAKAWRLLYKEDGLTSSINEVKF